MPKATPFQFVLEALEDSPLSARLRTRKMFGSLAVYVDEKIVFVLRRRQGETARDDGIWIASKQEYIASLKQEFPVLRSIEMFEGTGRTGFSNWLNLPEDQETFEETALELCRLVIHQDKRIGRIPNRRAQ